MAVASSCEAANILQLRRVPRSPALQTMVGGDRSWWTFLPASTASELMMVPIRLQLMLYPPKDEGHIPPAIVNTTTSSKRGRLQHDKKTTRRWCRPIVRLAATETKGQATEREKGKTRG